MSAAKFDASDRAELDAIADDLERHAKTLEVLARKSGAYRFIVLSAAGDVGHWGRRVRNVGRLSDGPDTAA